MSSDRVRVGDLVDDAELFGVDIRATGHARDMYRERLPADAVSFEAAWTRGEEIEHPQVLATRGPSPDPIRARVYNHDDEYIAVFVICRDQQFDGGEYIATVYNETTHEHEPTRAYIREHGPHYPLDGGNGGNL